MRLMVGSGHGAQTATTFASVEIVAVPISHGGATPELAPQHVRQAGQRSGMSGAPFLEGSLWLPGKGVTLKPSEVHRTRVPFSGPWAKGTLAGT